MAGRDFLNPYLTLPAGVMTGTNTLVSSVSDIRYLDNVCLESIWTGTPTGTINVQGCLDYQPSSPLLYPGTWVTITSSSGSNSPSGSAGSWLLDLNQQGTPFVRVQYINSTGSGTLNVYICGKPV